MNRREAARSLMLGAVVAALPGAALAQGMRGGGDAERRHAMETLRVGSVALQSSQLAERRAMKRSVKEFAGFEVAEQTTIADIIREASGMTPPPPDPAARAMMARLMAARGAAFDAAYIRGQLDGHRELLAIQERYLADGRDPHMRHVAMLARGQIKEHIALLNDMRMGRR